jgi:hypothetical protein
VQCVQVDAVPAGRLLWQLTWDQMLSVELAYHRQQTGAPPDGIIVHRKYRSEDTDVLVHDVRCNPNNNQVTLGVLGVVDCWDEQAAEQHCAWPQVPNMADEQHAWCYGAAVS